MAVIRSTAKTHKKIRRKNQFGKLNPLSESSVSPNLKSKQGKKHHEKWRKKNKRKDRE